VAWVRVCLGVPAMSGSVPCGTGLGIGPLVAGKGVGELGVTFDNYSLGRGTAVWCDLRWQFA